MAEKEKPKKIGKCVNCQREGVVIKCQGCCANCYDTPLRKGYKRGSKEWTACLAEIRARFDPLFKPQPEREKVPEVTLFRRHPEEHMENTGLEQAGVEKGRAGCPEYEGSEGPAEILTMPPMTWDEVVRNGFAPAAESQEGMCPEVQIVFRGTDRGILAHMEARAKVNRRIVSDEILAILETVINKEKETVDQKKWFLEYADRSQAANEAAMKRLYSIKTPEGKTVPAEELSGHDKKMIAGVVLTLVIVLGAIFLYFIKG